MYVLADHRACTRGNRGNCFGTPTKWCELVAGISECTVENRLKHSRRPRYRITLKSEH